MIEFNAFISSLLSSGVVSVITGVSVFAIIAIIGVSIVIRQKRVLKRDTNGDKQQELYEEYIGNDVEKTLKSVGINPDEYNRDCDIAGIKPNYYSLIFSRIAGLVILCAAVALAMTGNAYIGVVAMILSLLVMNAPKKKAKRLATERKERFNAEIPRFLDMLDSALTADMPIQNAMEYTTKYLDGVLAEEMRFALAETEMGAKNWNDALFDVANKYDNNNFSDFALDISTAYNKGVPIIESVERKSRQIKESNLLLAKEKAASLTSKVLLPTMIFKMIPVMAAFLLPVFSSVNMNF